MARLAEVAGEVDFPAGSWIVRQGQVGTGLYVILSGRARVIRGADELAELREGEFFGELAVIDQQPRNASVQARDATPSASRWPRGTCSRCSSTIRHSRSI